MTSEDDDLLPLSGLEHLAYCERQCALIHVEGLWIENRWTDEGRAIHERVDSGERETRPEVEVRRGVAIVSQRLGLRGIADVVEFRRRADGRMTAYPVEYKRGPRRRWLHDEIQLCAQGMSLEEMLGVEVPAGALFHGASNRRREVVFDEALRGETERAAKRFHELVRTGATPAARHDARCKRCSLEPICLPAVTEGRSVEGYLREILRP